MDFFRKVAPVLVSLSLVTIGTYLIITAPGNNKKININIDNILNQKNQEVVIPDKDETVKIPVDNTEEKKVIVEALDIIEDSRCPESSVCGWEGTVKTNVRVINKFAEVETGLLSLGETRSIAGVSVTFVSVNPKKTEKVLKFEDYKFDFKF